MWERLTAWLHRGGPQPPPTKRDGFGVAITVIMVVAFVGMGVSESRLDNPARWYAQFAIVAVATPLLIGLGTVLLFRRGAGWLRAILPFDIAAFRSRTEPSAMTYSALEDAALATGQASPAVRIVALPSLNAALLSSWEIHLTRGLEDALPADEMRAVLTHLLVKLRDTEVAQTSLEAAAGTGDHVFSPEMHLQFAKRADAEAVRCLLDAEALRRAIARVCRADHSMRSMPSVAAMGCFVWPFEDCEREFAVREEALRTLVGAEAAHWGDVG